VKGVYTTPIASPAPSTAPGSPATSDESNLVLWVVVLAAGSAALVGSFLIQRKKRTITPKSAATHPDCGG